MRRRALVLLAALALGGCFGGSDETILEGERRPVREVADDRLAPIEARRQLSALPEPQALAAWTQPNAVASRAPGHVAGPAAPREVWRADAGAGGGGRVTSAPVVADGRIFALDAEAAVSAFEAGSGDRLWRAELTPEGERRSEGFGGGLALAEGRVIAATGFGEVAALSAADGSELWRRRLTAPLRAAPAVEEGRVVVVTRDNQGWALDLQSGDVLWRAEGAPGGAGVLGGASPAAGAGVAVLPFSSGELLAVRLGDGGRLWSDLLRGARRGLARSAIADVSGDPVIVGVGVFASTQNGLLAAIDGRTGRRGWVREIGATSPVWAVGPTLYVVDVDGRLMRIAAPTGETLWSTELPVWDDPDDREGRVTYAGPVVAGGLAWIVSSAGELLGFDAVSGERRQALRLPHGASVGPVAAGGAIYVLTDGGALVAFR
jgi:outer membrane protein assembly factor BamB